MWGRRRRHPLVEVVGAMSGAMTAALMLVLMVVVAAPFLSIWNAFMGDASLPHPAGEFGDSLGVQALVTVEVEDVDRFRHISSSPEATVTVLEVLGRFADGGPELTTDTTTEVELRHFWALHRGGPYLLALEWRQLPQPVWSVAYAINLDARVPAVGYDGDDERAGLERLLVAYGNDDIAAAVLAWNEELAAVSQWYATQGERWEKYSTQLRQREEHARFLEEAGLPVPPHHPVAEPANSPPPTPLDDAVSRRS